ncbi:ABC transporter ATP-binding protein [Infirmifilum lucidum]|uniref:ABC transporter ATP-binding protein n=1 Tax=Infirmifilum lucidum TaxID=2776706 RepID=A0A7L9FI29_9CREN|nr:ABC transporter ATP-binding protein [Infirmifilum lucidum]QOJ79409.1 ABC transporter ATP-binding protein [Infirmifilum lucidum]
MGSGPDRVVSLKNVYARYVTSEKWIVEDVSLEASRGEMIVLMGPSGCGKSTLLNVIAGLLPGVIPGVVEGEVIIDGINPVKQGYRALRGRVGIVYQNPEIQIITRSVYEELAMAPENLGLPKEEVISRVEWALDALGLRGYENKDPQTLSGGEKQLVAIASVLTMKPKLLLLDEPTSMLDHTGTRLVLKAITTLKEEYGLTIIAAEHRVEWAVDVADRVYLMADGRIVLGGTPDDVFSDIAAVTKLGVRPPGVTEVAYELYRRGINVGFPVRLRNFEKFLGVSHD